MLGTIGSIAGYILWNLYKNCSMSDAEATQRLSTQDMVEMRELMDERQYHADAGKILLPTGV